MPRVFDVGGLDVAVIDAEHQDQQHLGDEKQPEEEGEAPQCVLAPPLERRVIDLIDRCAERIERRKRDDRSDDRIDAEPLIGDVGDVGADDDEGRVGDIDDVEDTERDRYPDRHGGIEAADQHTRDDGVDE